ncbi:beta-Ala-His dipeptidase [Pedobacter sp. NJ-S-72]
MGILSVLEPKSVWHFFEEISAIPRGSRKEQKIAAYLISFAAQRNLFCKTDATGNILISKDGQGQNKNSEKVALQGHMDMVQQKSEDKVFDFDEEGIDLKIDGDFVTADQTTLGADNGIGLAYMLSILDSKEMDHPPLEALFTINEESGMTGAHEMEPDFFSASRLLNLDIMVDDLLRIGSAGAVNVLAKHQYEVEENDWDVFQIVIKGLKGGHSAADINKNRGNAIKILFRFFAGVNSGLKLIDLDGGGLRNAIPRDGKAVFGVQTPTEFLVFFEELKKDILLEYQIAEPDLIIDILPYHNHLKSLSLEDSLQIIEAVFINPTGVYQMSAEIKDLVETSNNLATIQLKDGELNMVNLCRSSVDSKKKELSNVLKALYNLFGWEVTFTGDYPGWRADLRGDIVQKAASVYETIFKQKPRINGGHGGSECGLFIKHHPNLEIVSFGPNIYGAHSPEEKVEIKSVEKIWKLLTSLLSEL